MTAEVVHKQFNFCVKGYDPAKPLEIEGYANFAEVDRGMELMPKECWNLENYMKNPIMLFDHDYSRPIGRIKGIEATDEGLKIVGIVGDPSAGHQLTDDQIKARSLLAQGVLNSFSVGFIPHDWTVDTKTGVLTYKLVELLEVSVVSVPMQQSSQITSIKRMKEMAEPNNDSSTDVMAAVKAIGEKLDNMQSKLDAVHEMCTKMTTAENNGSGAEGEGTSTSTAEAGKSVADAGEVKALKEQNAALNQRLEKLVALMG